MNNTIDDRQIMYANGLRQRKVSTNNFEANRDSTPSMSAGLSMASLEAASPIHTGYVMKLSIPVFYTMLPRCIQYRMKQLLTRFPSLSVIFPLQPEWKYRYIMLVGSFLYKYSPGKQEPKGSPIKLQPMEFTVLTETDIENLLHDCWIDMPINYRSIFCMESLRKKYYFACIDHEEAQTWVNTLHQAQQEAIRRSLGHAPEGSYPSSWNYLDKLGNDLLHRKSTMNARMEKSRMVDVELVGISNGPMPRGYYG